MSKFTIVGHPDDPYFDESGIRLQDRYKTSEVSGDEWRYSYVLELRRKGQTVATKTVNGHSYAHALLAAAVHLSLIELAEQGWDVLPWEEIRDDLCCHPGCRQEGVNLLMLRKRWSPDCSLCEPNDGSRPYARRFCDEHRSRGDGGLDDSDTNYVLVSEAN